MKRKLVALAVLALVVLLALQAVSSRTDFFEDTKRSLFRRLIQGALLAAAAVLAWPTLAFWPAVAIASGILVVTGGAAALVKAFSPKCPDGLVKDDDSDVCLGFTPF